MNKNRWWHFVLIEFNITHLRLHRPPELLSDCVFSDFHKEITRIFLSDKEGSYSVHTEGPWLYQKFHSLETNTDSYCFSTMMKLNQKLVHWASCDIAQLGCEKSPPSLIGMVSLLWIGAISMWALITCISRSLPQCGWPATTELSLVIRHSLSNLLQSPICGCTASVSTSLKRKVTFNDPDSVLELEPALTESRGSRGEAVSVLLVPLN